MKTRARCAPRACTARRAASTLCSAVLSTSMCRSPGGSAGAAPPAPTPKPPALPAGSKASIRRRGGRHARSAWRRVGTATLSGAPGWATFRSAGRWGGRGLTRDGGVVQVGQGRLRRPPPPLGLGPGHHQAPSSSLRPLLVHSRNSRLVHGGSCAAAGGTHEARAGRPRCARAQHRGGERRRREDGLPGRVGAPAHVLCAGGWGGGGGRSAKRGGTGSRAWPGAQLPPALAPVSPGLGRACSSKHSWGQYRGPPAHPSTHTRAHGG